MAVLPNGAADRAPLQIGDWRVEPATNELCRGAETVRVEPKAMEVLLRLAEHPGQVVGREELFAAVWPGVVVGDEALTQCVIKLRRALGDNARAATYIETISKRGYRLIAPVQRAPAASHPAPRRVRTAVLAGVLAGLALAGAALYLHVAKTPATADSTEADEERLPTLTVLPFEWVGPGENAYLARGIGSDLMHDLSRLPGLRLIRAPQASSKDRPPPAGYVVSGTVQRAGEPLRINVYLMDGKSGRQIWSERFERPAAELFAMQDELTARLAEVLPGKLAGAARGQNARRYTRSLEAYDAFLRAQARFLVRHAEANDEARALYRKALELDPKFARAYAGLAMTYAMEYRLTRAPGGSSALARALELAETAKSIDPDLPEAHWAVGFVHVQSRRHELALDSLRRAIALDRSFADAYAFMGGIHTYIGEPGKSIPLMRRAMRLNPDAGYLYYLLLGRAYVFESDFEQALINLREAAARNPVDVETHLFLAAAMVGAGDRAGADWEAEQVRSLEPAFSAPKWLDSYPLTSPAHRSRLLELLAKAGL
jgi:DNA-binding winged helix-turn-helix (wHTH) protein/TolB-like protein/Tfp pilus assembly protein PilF